MRKKPAKEPSAPSARKVHDAHSQLPKKTSHCQPVRAAIYARTAAQRWGNDDALTRQINACKRTAAEEGLTMEDQVFIDSGVSGNSHPMSRPGFSELLRNVSATPKPFDVVICDDTRRLAGNFRDGIEILQKLKKNGVEVHFVADGLTGTEYCRIARWEMQARRWR